MDNQEILDRFDALYNNIMSDRAPGLDAKEISIFFNKAQLEELKNKLNPKGNKYVEGFDFSSKRQVEFSTLTESISLQVEEGADTGSHLKDTWIASVENNNFSISKQVLSIINEYVDTLPNNIFESIKRYNYILASDREYPNVADVTTFIAWMISNFDKTDPFYLYIYSLTERMRQIAVNTDKDAWLAFKDEFAYFTDIDTVIQNNNLSSKVETKVIVPITYQEYDTLMSRPYKFPPKSQAWRLLNLSNASIMVIPNVVPIHYRIRYIRVPQEVDLSYTDTTADDYSKHCCELPDFLIDEVLQRAVELAKNAWDGTIETTKAFGERSE